MAHETNMELGDFLRRPERWASVLGWATLAGLEFGLIGPFGSYASNVFTRIAYWTGLFWIGSLVLWPCVVAALLIGPRRGFPPIFSAAAAVLVACMPLAALGAAGTYLFWPVRASGMRTLEWYGLTIIVALPAISALVWLELRKASIFQERLGSAPTGEPKLLAGGGAMSIDTAGASPLPDHVLAAALCLQMEDHHVRVHTHGRSYLHFAVMRQVVDAMDEQQEGLQVHRSWWVARNAVQGWHKEDRSVVLILSNGLHVPVARNRVATLRAEGWLDAETERQASHAHA